MLPNIGYGELLVILIIVLVLFGAKRIPEIAKALGKSIQAFKSGIHEGSKEDEGKDEGGKKPPDEDKTQRL